MKPHAVWMIEEIFPPQVDNIAFTSEFFIGFLPSAYIWIGFYWMLDLSLSLQGQQKTVDV